MRAPLWLDIKMQRKGPDVTVSLAKCRNCGQVKATTTPCGFDHLAAVMEFGVLHLAHPRHRERAGMNRQERCGYAVTDGDGIEGPCDREATSWRWYEDCGHEEVLEPACFWHENESGKRIHALTSRLASVVALRDRLHAAALSGNRAAQQVGPELDAVLGSDAHTEQKKGAGE